MNAATEAKTTVSELVPLPLPLAEQQSLLQDLLQLTKARLSLLVLLSTLVGFYFGSQQQLNLALLCNTLLGTFLVAAGASVLNQILERDSDKLMVRTRNRPLPAGRMSVENVLGIGGLLSVAGMAYLLICVNLDAAMLAALTLGLYVFVYTPLKKVTTLNTLVGAVPGALPPLIGWAATGTPLDIRAWTLFAIMLIWQLPHFLAIAWLYRADYARAGLHMLPAVDPQGHSVGRQILVHSLTLLPVSLAPSMFGMAGALYFVSALVLGGGVLIFAARFAWKRNDSAARQLFLVSVTYLSLLLSLLMFDRLQ